MWGRCVDGSGWLDSLRDGQYSRENAGPGGWKAKEHDKRETKVRKRGVQAGRGSEENSAVHRHGGRRVRYLSESRTGLHLRESGCAGVINPAGVRIRTRM